MNKAKIFLVISLVVVLIGLIIVRSNVDKEVGQSKEKRTEATQNTLSSDKGTIIHKKEDDENARAKQKSIKENANIQKEYGIEKDKADLVDSDFVINNNFILEQVDDETFLKLIGGNTDKLKKVMQEYLYSAGYYKYTKAFMERQFTYDVKQKEVSCLFTVETNKECYLKGLYATTTKTWTFYVVDDVAE